jgi:hypothetical protein
MEWILSFVSHGLWSEEQNILIRHMHKKFWILTNKCVNKLKHENEAKGPFGKRKARMFPGSNKSGYMCGRAKEGTLLYSLLG